MKSTVSVYDFRQAFYNCGRGGQFSYEALGLIFDYFEECEDSCDSEIELDPIAVCCEFTEDTWESIADNYSIDTSDCEDEDDGLQAVEEYLLDRTSLVGITSDKQIVYSDF